MPKGGAHNPVVDRDKRSMQRKKRVTEVLEDQFRSELEDVVISQKEGNKPLFHAGIRMNTPGGPTGGSEFKGLANIRQVNDLNGSLRDKYSKSEREMRCKLAALYRLTAHFEWDHIIYSHITARLPDNEDHFLINPYGMQYSEITASSLIKVDKDGRIIDPGSTVLPVNKAGFKLNSALHETGQNIVYHTHSHAGTAISAMKCGLLNLCQEAIIVRPVSYGEYQGFVPNRAEQKQLQEDLLDNSNVMILENHGLVSVGPTIEETFLWMAQLTKACEIQWRVLRCGKDNLRDRTFDENKPFEGDLPVELECNPNGVEYGKGELEFESYMRMLDDQGANTGYPYKMPNIFKDQIPTYPAVQYPPIVPGMEGPPSDTDRSRTSTSQREAWFRNTQVVEQRISPPSTRKSDEESAGKGHGKRFAPFDSVVSSDGKSGASSRSSSKRSSRRSSKGSSRSSHKKRSSSSTESDGEAPPRPPPPSRPKHSGKSDSDGSGYTRVLNDAKKPDDTSDDEGPGRPPLPKDDSSVDGYHSTKSTESDSETTTHEVITEQKVEHEYFVDGAPIRRSPISSTSSMEEVPPASIQSIHSSSSLSSSSSSDSDSYVSSPSNDSKRSDVAEVVSLSDTASSEAVEVENEPFPTVEIEEIEEVEEMPEVASGYFNPVEEADKVWKKRLEKLKKPEVAPDEPSFAGKPNLRRPVRGEPLPHIPGQHAELLSSGSEGWDTPDEQYAGEIDPSFAGKPNLKRPLKGETTPRGSRHEAESLSSSDTDQGETPEKFYPTGMEPDSGSRGAEKGKEEGEEGSGSHSDPEIVGSDPEKADPWEGIPILHRDVSVDAKMSVTTDVQIDEDVEVKDEITVNTVTTSLIEITEVQEDEFEVITLAPGQLSDEQKAELIRQGYVLQEGSDCSDAKPDKDESTSESDLGN